MHTPSKGSLYASAIGTGVVALCCFTPLLVVVLGIVGLSVFTPYLDYVLFPALILCLIIFSIAYKNYKRKCNECDIRQ